LRATSGIITNLTGVAGTITSFDTTNLTGVAGTITTFNATTGIITNITSDNATIIILDNTNLTSVAGTITSFDTTNLTGVAATISTQLNVGTAFTVTSSGDVVTIGIVTASQFSTGFTGIGINTDTISGPAIMYIDPAPVGVGTTSGIVRIRGDLYVDGTQFVVNSSTIELADLRVGIATTVGTNLLLDGGGIGIGSANILKTFTYNNSSDSLKSSVNLDIATGYVYKINGTEVLSSNTLGTGVVNSSLTSVGTLGQLNVSGVSTLGVTTASQLQVTGISTLGVTSATNLTSQQLRVSGISTLGVTGTTNLTSQQLQVSGITTLGVTTASQLQVSGISTLGVTSTTNLTSQQLIVSGISTFAKISDGATVGTSGQYLQSTGIGVSWATFPTLRTSTIITATAGQTVFSFTYNVNFLDVFVNGVKLAASEFTATNGSTVTLTSPSFVNDIVELISYNTTSAGINITGQDISPVMMSMIF
jgi:hypothetical protein